MDQLLSAARNESDWVPNAAELQLLARKLRDELESHATEVDENGIFPQKGLDEIRKCGLMGLVVEQRYGGIGASFSTMAEVTQTLAEGCTSTAMIWAMHCQQVATIADYAERSLCKSLLPRISSGELYIASVTSERDKGGELLTALAPLHRIGNEAKIHRDAPVVTGGANADAFLITMRANPDANPSDVVLVFAERSQVKVETRSAWRSMGMRGTQSEGLVLEGQVPANHIIRHAKDFKHIAVSTMVPVGHIAWAAAWIGSARGAFRRLLTLLRDPARRKAFPVHSDLFGERLAEIRLQLDAASALLHQVSATYDRMRTEEGIDSNAFASPWFNLQINNLKIAASELAFSTVDRMVQLAGLRHGYLAGSEIALDRVFRDLRSAALMYANDRLRVVNGKLTLLDLDVRLA
ncbi:MULTISPECIES: acyl-CoA dehydrogenase family protein [unclassified Bradyrhizobium]|uniref:acyl-CoA dehydrogenase family protein n=1 Tax=unclassified Bradyrhizobium TaxID=2631580 RepID=UPI0028E7AE89|nr:MULTISPECIES: acyl-CoA dehydrogenase family protein [unclassified Bradyrhizobium]